MYIAFDGKENHFQRKVSTFGCGEGAGEAMTLAYISLATIGHKTTPSSNKRRK